MTIPTGKTHAACSAADDDLPDSLRWQLRALRRDEPPQRELWPDIAARLQPAEPAVSSLRRHWMLSFAAAATLVIALGVTGLWRGDLPPGLSSSPDVAPVTDLQREAAGLARQYDAALTEVSISHVAAPPALRSTMDELDRSLGLIHDALARNPDSRLLLDQLRRTYAHRLALAKRAA